jgi:hypothetical protein
MDALAVPGSLTLNAITAVFGFFMGRPVPEHVRVLLFGARLVGLVKALGPPVQLRPIASGDVFRRAGGKFLMRTVNDDARDFLVRVSQFGVSVPGGADAIVFASRLYSANLPTDSVVVALDFRNAYNSLFRDAFLGAVEEHFPVLLPYALASYVAPTTLLVGAHTILSACGVQQGDPLAPLFFSLGLGSALQKARAAVSSLPPFEAWYLDDGIVGGPIPVVTAYVSALQEECQKIGLILRPDKCHLITRQDQDTHTLTPLLLSLGSRAPSTSWTVLGCPVGDETHARSTCDQLALRVTAKVARISSIPDPQVGYALLRFCGSFPLSNFLVRAVGPIAQHAFSSIDESIVPALAALGLALPVPLDLLSAPAHYGGLGLRSAATYSSVAFIAAWHAGSLLRKFIIAESFLVTIDPLLDPFYVAARTAIVNLHIPDLDVAVEKMLASPSMVRHGQRQLSAIVDEFLFKQRKANAAPVHVARWMSSAVKHANTWLCPRPGDEDPLWLPPPCFSILIRHRFALPLSANPSSVCTFCGIPEAVDPYGLHSLLCASGGSRWGMHNALRDQLYFICRQVNWSPRLEVKPFPLHQDLRLDIVASTGPGAPRPLMGIDVTVVSPLAVATMAAAVTAPGAAALLAETAKRHLYGSAATEVHMDFVPFVLDVFGAFSKSALALLKPLAAAWGSCNDMLAHRAGPLLANRLITTTMMAISRVLLYNTAEFRRVPTETRMQFVPRFSGVPSLPVPPHPSPPSPTPPDPAESSLA